MSRLKRLLNPETRERQELTVELGPAEALEACKGAVEKLGWAAKERPNGDGARRLTVYEDFTRLHCGDSPIRMELELRPEDGGRRCIVEVDAVVPGVGGVSNKHLSEGVMVFSLLLGRQAKARSS